MVYIEFVDRKEVGLAQKQIITKTTPVTRSYPLRKFYGDTLAEVFRAPLYDRSLKNTSGVPDFAMTRLKGGR